LSYQAWSFAIFNVADTAITLGAIATAVSLCLEAA
jgi:signal peptidase II